MKVIDNRKPRTCKVKDLEPGEWFRDRDDGEIEYWTRCVMADGSEAYPSVTGNVTVLGMDGTLYHMRGETVVERLDVELHVVG